MKRGDKTYGLLLVMFLVGCSHLPSGGLAPAKWNRSVQEELRSTLTSSPTPTLEGEPLLSPKTLAGFYRERAYAPAWSRNGSLSDQVEPFVEVLAKVKQEGLLPADYHAETIEALWNKLNRDSVQPPVAQSATLDLLLTDAYFLYASHLAGGKVDRADLEDTEVFLPRRPLRLAALLREALDRHRIEDSLDDLRPQAPGFARLREALEDYREIAHRGGWPVIPKGPTLKVGQNAFRVWLLKRRLMASGEYARGDLENRRFDEGLEDALKKFQESHGLKPSGVLDSKTLSELNVPVRDRIAQIEANLERWRWLSREKQDRYLLVSTADYKVQLVEGGDPILSMRAIIGLTDKETPVFRDEMTYLVINPSWNVPRSIATEEILPKLQKDPAYLKKMDIQVFEGTGRTKHEVQPETIDWGRLSEENFPYQLRQAPGANNPLGSIKFIFPNPYGIYLHGTINRRLFEREKRAFSHGCIRIEKPMELALALLKDNKRGWDEQKLEAALEKGEERTIPLDKPLPVRIEYWTAWVNDEGSLQFRPDVYAWDRTLVRALNQPLTAQKTGE